MFKISWKGGIANKSIKTLYEGSKLSMINVCLWLCGLFHLLIIHVLLVFLNIYTNLLNHDCFKACFYKKFGLTVLRLVMGFHWTGCFCLIEALFLFSSEIFFTPIPTGFFSVPIKGGGIWGATSSPGRFFLALSAYGFTIPSPFLLVDGNDLLVLEWSVNPILGAPFPLFFSNSLNSKWNTNTSK